VSGPPSRRDDQTGSSAEFVLAIARSTGAKVRIDGDDAVIGTTRVRIDETPRDRMRALLGQRRSRRVTLTADDVRAIASGLPSVTERDVPARDGRTAISFDVSRTMFVKLFAAGNLLPPDVDDVVLIRRVPERAALLATAPERFFLTRHYGDPSSTGPVLTRLSENTRADLDELTELISESWALCAPKRVVASWRRGSP
jgi:hypothetical protein